MNNGERSVSRIQGCRRVDWPPVSAFLASFGSFELLFGGVAVSKSSTVLVSSAAVEKLEYPKTGSSPIDMTGKHRLLITGQTDDALANCPKLYVVGYSDDSHTIDSTKRLGYST